MYQQSPRQESRARHQQREHLQDLQQDGRGRRSPEGGGRDQVTKTYLKTLNIHKKLTQPNPQEGAGRGGGGRDGGGGGADGRAWREGGGRDGGGRNQVTKTP